MQKLSGLSVELSKSTEPTSSYSIWQAVSNINNSISQRKFPKIIMTCIFDSLKSFLLVTLLIL